MSACSPSLYPLYRDYEVQPGEAPVEERVTDALHAAGWKRVDGITPNVVATNERQLRRWGIYSVVVSLELIPIGDEHVRLLIHPYRDYIWGTRSKIAFLNPTVRRAVLRDFDTAMSNQHLIAVGSGVSRDRHARDD